MLAIDAVMSVILVCFTGGVTSPFTAILAFMIISGSYWYGEFTAVAIGFAEAVTVLVIYNVHSRSSYSSTVFVLQMAIYISIGIYVSMLSLSERSERKELLTLEKEIEGERKQLLTLINNIGDAVFVVDSKSRVMLFNLAAANLLGSDNLLRKSVKDLLLFHEQDKKDVTYDIKKLSSLTDTADLQLKAKDGSYMNVKISSSPYTVDLQHRGYVLIIRDITKEKTIEQERGEFAAVAAHELRTPLTIAQGDVSFLLSPPFLPPNPESVHLLNGAMRSLKQLSHIINDLTNLSEVDSQKLNVKLEPLNPLKLLKELESDFNDQAKVKGITIGVKLDEQLDIPVILTSRYVVQEILATLISNAIKFSEEGKIILSVVKNKSQQEGVTFSVTDTGIGISQSDQKKIFQKFFQSEDFMTRSHGGTGLGLYIAKKLADRLTAKLSFETKLGSGSTFYLWVPPYSRDKKDTAEVASAGSKELFSGL
jgi:PAS domain S-box-containing protein